MNADSRHRFHPRTLANARAQRQQSVPAEHTLWQRIRSRQLDGLKFRRQVSIGKYIADFLCHEVKLIVELDGPSHEARALHDQERTNYLNEEGYRVIRFLNEDVHQNLDAVLRTILRECGRKPD